MVTFASHALSRANSRTSSVPKYFTAFGIGFPSGLSSRAATKTGTSCDWQFNTQAERLYKEIGPALLGYFRRQPALAGTAEDLLQDTFVRAFAHPERLRTSISQRAYLFGIARHVGIDALRRQRPAVELPEDAPAATDAPDVRLEPMRRAISRLPETQREALILKLQQDLSYAEIAEALDIPVGTVRSRLHFALLHLRRVLNPAQNET